MSFQSTYKIHHTKNNNETLNNIKFRIPYRGILKDLIIMTVYGQYNVSVDCNVLSFKIFQIESGHKYKSKISNSKHPLQTH